MAAEHPGRRLPPLWLGNLLVFGLLTALVAGWFFFQTRQVQRGFLEDASAHARLVADAVALHARGAVASQQVTEAMLTAFLGSSARFVNYLDDIEPFRPDELAAFAAETGLSVIRVVRPGETVQGPSGWPAPDDLGCDRLQRLLRLAQQHAVLFGVAREGGAAGCVLVGMDSRRIESLEAAVGLPRALEGVAALPGVLRVTLSGEPDPALEQDATAPEVEILTDARGRSVARARTRVAGAALELDLDTGPLHRQHRQLWLELLALVLALSLAGGLGTWLLFRHQQAHDRQLRGFERRLSQQREEAGLGRAAASIAHEIRNPLNAMAMGLQRLQMEAQELEPEHRRLVAVVLEAVRRTNGSITGLLDYARPYRPRNETLQLDRLVRDRLSLYEGRLRELGVTPGLELAADCRVTGDPDLLRQVLDNLLRNALEALPPGGRLAILVERVKAGTRLAVENDGLTLEPEQVERILEPWFTTRTEGTGLGLAISRRILAAHGGHLEVAATGPGRLRVQLVLPA